MKKYIILTTIILIACCLQSQQLDLSWQRCLGSDTIDYPDAIAKSERGVFVSISVIYDYPWLTNYHGGGDAWIVELDTKGNILQEKCFGGSKGEGIKKIVSLPNDEYYLFGGTISIDGDVQHSQNPSFDIWVVKVDSLLNIIWERCYGSYALDSPKDAISTPDGGMLFLSSITSSGLDVSTSFGSSDAWLCRIDSEGNIMWEKTYGNHSSSELFKIIPTSYGTYMMVGKFYESGGMITCPDLDGTMQYKDVWVVEINEYGEILQQFSFGGSYYDGGWSIIEDNGDFIIGAYTDSDDINVSGFNGEPGNVSTEDIWILKIDHEGNIIWQDCFGGSFTEGIINVNRLDNDRYIVIGTSNSIDGDIFGHHSTLGGWDPDIWYFILSKDGEFLDQRCIGGLKRETLPTHSVAKIADDHFMLIAETNVISGDVECEIDADPWGYLDKDAWVFSLKDCNNYQPGIPVVPTGTDTLCVNTDSITTYTTQQATNAWYYQWQLQPEEAGTITGDSLTAIVNWNPNYEGPALLKVRSSNDCGESNWSDSLVIQAYTCLGTDDNDIENSLRVYPNPATNTLIIEKQNHNKTYNIEIYNSTGTKVFTTNTATKITSIDVSEWISGVYVVKVASGSSCVSKKVVVR